MRSVVFALTASLVSAMVAPANAEENPPLPAALDGVEVEEHLGARLPLDLRFQDSTGAGVRLGDYFGHGRPVVLTLGYFECPMLCSLLMNGLVEGLRGVGTGWRPARDYDLLSISIDPKDTPGAAGAKRRSYLKSLDTAISEETKDSLWPFLTGAPESIRSLADALGFHYNYLPGIKQYAHPAVVFLLAPDGTITRYLYGVSFASRDLRLALAESAAGRAGPSVDRFLLSCFRYSPASRQYRFFIFGFLRLGALVIFFMLATLLFVLWRAEARRGRS